MSDSNNEQIVVLITGASGFLAGHIIQLLLTNKEHKFLVHGTVRSLIDHRSKYSYLYDMQLFPNQLILFQCDLTSKSNSDWKKAMLGCKYILHTANPTLNRSPEKSGVREETEEQYVNIVMNGMKNIFQTMAEINSMEVERKIDKQRIERIIYTSSVNALEYNKDLIISASKALLIDDKQWSIIDGNHWQISPYTKCKTMAEKFAWNFIETQPQLNCDLICIHPGTILGPLLNKRKAGSLDFILLPILGEYPFLPKICTAFVDVRDVAHAHLNAMFVDINDDWKENKENVGKQSRHRYICVNQSLWFSDICCILKEKYYKMGYDNIPTYVAPDFIWSIIAIFEPVLAQVILPNLNVLKIFDNHKTVNDLRICFTPIHQTIYDTVESLIQYGYIIEPESNWKSIRRYNYYKRIVRNSMVGIGMCAIAVFTLNKYFISVPYLGRMCSMFPFMKKK